MSPTSSGTPSPDERSSDQHSSDRGASGSGSLHSGSLDGGWSDGGSSDSGSSDGGSSGSGWSDGGSSDGGSLDSGSLGVRSGGGRSSDGRSSGERSGGRRGGKRGRGGDRSMVPEADFQSYYGRPIVRPPVWTHDIAIYLFTGGLAAGSAMVAAGGQATNDPVLRVAGRATAMGALGASAFFLIKDLGRPDRFHHMLRVAKPTSPMSMGTWLLSFFGGAAGLAAAAEVAPFLPDRGVLGLARKVLPPVGAAAGYGAALLAPGLATYTAVLFSDTAVPSWNAAYPDLPFMFAGSALASGAGVGLIAAPGRAMRRMAVAGAAVELAAGRRVEHGHGLLSEPYRKGRPGKLLRAARLLTAVGAVGAVVGHRSRVVSALAGASLLAGSVLTRFGVFEGGVESAKDPRYTVIPQREGLNKAGGVKVSGGPASPPSVPGGPASA